MYFHFHMPHNTKYGVNINGRNLNRLHFVDDTVLILKRTSWYCRATGTSTKWVGLMTSEN